MWAKKGHNSAIHSSDVKPEFVRNGKPSFYNPDDDEFNRKARKNDFKIMSGANRRNHQREFMFQVSGGYSIDGKGSTPKEALKDAKRKLDDMKKKPVWKDQNLGHITGNYNTYGKDGTAPTGYYPKSIKT